MQETTILNLNTKTSSKEKEEILIVKSKEKIQLSQNTKNQLNLKCPFCQSKNIFLQIPEYNFLRLENTKTNKIRASDLNYYPILFCDNFHPFCSICHQYPHIGKNCDDDEETTLNNIFSITEILKNDVPNEKIDRFLYLKKKSMEKSTNVKITITEENEIKENYTSLSITQEEKFPIDNSSLGYIKCPKCLKFDSNLELIIPNYDFMQIEDINTKMRIWKPIHYFPIAFCKYCKFPICTICSKDCHPVTLCNDKNLITILNINKQLDLLEPNVPEFKKDRFKELRVIAFRHAIDYLEYKKNPNKLPKKKIKLNNVKETSTSCCESCVCKKLKCSCSCVGIYILMIFLFILWTPFFLALFGLSLFFVALSLAFQALAGIYFCIQYYCCQKEIGRETKGNVTTIYLDGDYDKQLKRELEQNCEFFSICGQNCFVGIFLLALIPYLKIYDNLKYGHC